MAKQTKVQDQDVKGIEDRSNVRFKAYKKNALSAYAKISARNIMEAKMKGDPDHVKLVEQDLDYVVGDAELFPDVQEMLDKVRTF